MRRIGKFIHNIHAPTWLGILVAIVLVLRIPSFFEPYYYGDEMIYLTLGQGIRQSVPLYLGLHDNKPPLIYLLAAVAGNLFWFKAILAAFNVISIIFFWKLGEALFKNKEKLVKISTVIFALLTTIPYLEGNTVNAELLMVAPTIAAFWILFSKKNTGKNLFFAGLLFSLAALFKIPAVFEFPVIFVFWALIASTKNGSLFGQKFYLKGAFYLTLGFFIPIGLSFAWFYLKGVGREYFTAAFLQNFGYLSTWRAGTTAWGNFFAGKESLIIRGVVVLIGTAVLFLLRKRLSKQFLFLCLWLFFSLFAITLSERPYPHYLIQAIPPVSFLFGMLVANKTLEQSLTVIPLAIFFFVPNFYNFWSYPTTPYYVRFIKYLTQKQSRMEYFAGFDSKVSHNYQVAEILAASSTSKERVFVWGSDSPTIYALSKRLPPVKYVADYHVFDYSSQKKVVEELSEKGPKLIVFLPGARAFPELRVFAQKNYLLIDNSDQGEIWLKSK